MNLLILLVLESWQVAYGQAVLERLHTYDLLRCEVEAKVLQAGVAVDCRLTVAAQKTGPLRFFLSPEVEGLKVERAGKPVEATLSAGGFGWLLSLIGKGVEGLPGILELPAVEAGEVATFRLRYVWRPSGKGMAYAGDGRVQTHLTSFWLPTMAEEFFEAALTVRSQKTVIATRSKQPRQLLCFVAGDFDLHERGKLELYWPRGLEGAKPKALLDDLAAVLAKLEEWFGPIGDEGFRLVVEPRDRPSPSYCAGSFAVIHRAWLAAPRARWIAHLAHECSHAWFGHKLGSPVVGDGGTWLREGLAEWCGNRVAGALLGAEAERKLFRACFRGYFSRIDLRRSARAPHVVFANEPTLFDATYLDHPAVPYLRGALVHRLLEQRLGAEKFRAVLKTLLQEHAYGFLRGDGYARALELEALVSYYAKTSRLPDFEIVKVEPGRVAIRCKDPDWPGGRVPVVVDAAVYVAEMKGGAGAAEWPVGEAVLPKRVEIDPERVFLDPVRSNNLWERK